MSRHEKVFTNGCFDLLHIGHVKFLKFCASLGDELVVGLNSDKSVHRIKGEFRPINSQEDRKDMLLSIGVGISQVIIFDEDTPERLIHEVKPDILVKGSEWYGNVVGQAFVESYGGKVVLYQHSDNHSTTEIIEKVRKLYAKSKTLV